MARWWKSNILFTRCCCRKKKSRSILMDENLTSTKKGSQKSSLYHTAICICWACSRQYEKMTKTMPERTLLLNKTASTHVAYNTSRRSTHWKNATYDLVNSPRENIRQIMKIHHRKFFFFCISEHHGVVGDKLPVVIDGWWYCSPIFYHTYCGLLNKLKPSCPIFLCVYKHWNSAKWNILKKSVVLV